ncbi:MAG: GMC family oxidoreductase [Steroidobacteraceae bacterium]
MKRRNFLLLSAGTAAVAAAGGWAIRWRIGEQQVPVELKLRTRPLAQFDDKVEYDVCVIGSGIIGAVVAQNLAADGKRVVVIESGYSPFDTVDPKAAELEVFRNAGSIEYPFLSTRVRAVGGTTLIWTGNSERYLPVDFARTPQASEFPGWPISYEQIEPYYERAKDSLHVLGYVGSRFAPPRRNALSLPLGGRLKYWLRSSLGNTYFPQLDLQKAMFALGIESDVFPRSTVAKADPQPWRAIAHSWPLVSADPHITLLTGATATSLETSTSGAVVSVEVKNPSGLARRIRAGQFVIAAGGVETARLLLQSTNSHSPHGVGNGHDLVGRCFMESPDLVFLAPAGSRMRGQFGKVRYFAHYAERAAKGLPGIILAVDHSQPEDVLRIECGIQMLPHAAQRISLDRDKLDVLGNPTPVLTFDWSDSDQETFAAGRALVKDLCGQLGAGDPVEQKELHWGHHHKGLCRMGTSPAHSVVDVNSRLHEASNCYLAGSAVFSGSGLGHPTVLAVALAHRLTDHLKAVSG